MEIYVVDTKTGREIPMSRWGRFKAKVHEIGIKVNNWYMDHINELIITTLVICHSMIIMKILK